MQTAWQSVGAHSYIHVFKSEVANVEKRDPSKSVGENAADGRDDAEPDRQWVSSAECRVARADGGVTELRPDVVV